ncbi:MAG TPA: hypothetical protein VGL01_21605 [Trinickia sp.]|uniref:hypothetical protein n=1 Tax=Trinickia sp. TaxID=2571163 RepID=UPI002F40F1AA
MNYKLSSTKSILISISAIALVAILIIPYTRNGLWFDDSLNSETWGLVNRFHTNWLNFSLQVCLKWLTSYGRILLCWPAIYGFFYYVHDALTVRVCHVSLLIIHLLLTIWLLKKLGLSGRATGFFILLLPIMFQIRNNDDPIASYAMFSQALGILLVVSLMALRCACIQANIRWLALSGLLAALSTTFYEENVVYLPMALVATALSFRARRAAALFVVSAPFALLFIGIFLAKHGATLPYDGSQFGRAADIPVTYIKQLFSALPGSFYATSGRTEISLTKLIELTFSSPLALTVAALWFLMAAAVLRSHARRDGAPNFLIGGAAALLFLPPLLISVSAKYQATLAWGGAHIPVYYEYFGLALMIAIIVDRTVKNASIAALVGALLLSITLAMNWTMNMHQSAKFDAVFREPRESFVAALGSGLLRDVHDGDILRMDGQPIFINGNLIFQTIGKRIVLEREAAIFGWFEAAPRPHARRFKIWRDAANGHWNLENLSQ